MNFTQTIDANNVLGDVFRNTHLPCGHNILNEIVRPEKNKYLHDLAMDTKEGRQWGMSTSVQKDEKSI